MSSFTIYSIETPLEDIEDTILDLEKTLGNLKYLEKSAKTSRPSNLKEVYTWIETEIGILQTKRKEYKRQLKTLRRTEKRKAV